MGEKYDPKETERLLALDREGIAWKAGSAVITQLIAASALISDLWAELEARDKGIETMANVASAARGKALHDAWHECKAIESEYTSRNDPQDDWLSQVATECANAVERLAKDKP